VGALDYCIAAHRFDRELRDLIEFAIGRSGTSRAAQLLGILYRVQAGVGKLPMARPRKRPRVGVHA
jgi:hypothetical protein